MVNVAASGSYFHFHFVVAVAALCAYISFAFRCMHKRTSITQHLRECACVQFFVYFFAVRTLRVFAFFSLLCVFFLNNSYSSRLLGGLYALLLLLLLVSPLYELDRVACLSMYAQSAAAAAAVYALAFRLALVASLICVRSTVRCFVVALGACAWTPANIRRYSLYVACMHQHRYDV